MAVVKCNNGHFYNDSESASCPYCSGAGTMGKTIPLGNADADYFNQPGSPEVGSTVMLDSIPTMAIDQGGPEIPKTEFVKNPEYGQTVMIDEKQNSEIKPVRGWIVVIEGEKKGLDFRIHNGFNYIGRSSHNDICFDFDQSISKEKCCSITYDDRKKQFYVALGEGTNNIYINDNILLQPTLLKDFDIIEIGNTKLVFRSLCSADYDY